MIMVTMVFSRCEIALLMRFRARTMKDQEQGGRPGQFNLVLIGHARKIVDQDRQRGRGLHQVEFASLEEPVFTEQCGKQEGRGFSAARATASITPVMIPGMAVGMTTFVMTWRVGAAHAVGRVFHDPRHHFHGLFGG